MKSFNDPSTTQASHLLPILEASPAIYWLARRAGLTLSTAAAVAAANQFGGSDERPHSDLF